MSRRLALALILSALVVVVATLLLLGRSKEEPATAESPETPSPVVEEALTEVRLFFPGQGGWLYTEVRPLALDGDLRQRVRTLVEAVLSGPATAGLQPPLPAGTSLGGVDALEEEGVVYVDLHSEGVVPPAGSRREMLMVYSLVDSVTLNLEEVERVGLLWNGSQRSTLAGHLDLTRPLPPDLRLVAERLDG